MSTSHSMLYSFYSQNVVIKYITYESSLRYYFDITLDFHKLQLCSKQTNLYDYIILWREMWIDVMCRSDEVEWSLYRSKNKNLNLTVNCLAYLYENYELVTKLSYIRSPNPERSTVCGCYRIVYIYNKCEQSMYWLGYGMDFDSRQRQRFFSLHQRVHSGSGAQPASYPMSTVGSFTGDKAAGACSWPLTSI
jgi:hypothetical protein